jgi:hypothetical protein
LHQLDERVGEPEKFPPDDVEEKYFVVFVERKSYSRLSASDDATPVDATPSLVRFLSVDPFLISVSKFFQSQLL